MLTAKPAEPSTSAEPAAHLMYMGLGWLSSERCCQGKEGSAMLKFNIFLGLNLKGDYLLPEVFGSGQLRTDAHLAEPSMHMYRRVWKNSCWPTTIEGIWPPCKLLFIKSQYILLHLITGSNEHQRKGDRAYKSLQSKGEGKNDRIGTTCWLYPMDHCPNTTIKCIILQQGRSSCGWVGTVVVAV